jgi:Holliday junction resolvase RusA-like endonuclease
MNGNGFSNALTFTVPGPPVAKGRARAFRLGNQVRLHTPEKTARYENLVAMTAQTAMGDRPLIEGAVAVEIVLFTAIPSSWSQKKRSAALKGVIRPTTKPDCSNVLKAIEDGMNGIVFVDDKQITDVRVRKFYGEVPSAAVVVREIHPEPRLSSLSEVAA